MTTEKWAEGGVIDASLWDNRNDITFAGQTWGKWADDFGDWLSEKLPLPDSRNSTPRFCRQKAAYRYARVKDVARYCLQNFDRPYTVWLSLTARSRIQGRWVDPEIHDADFRSNAVKTALYRCRESADIDEYAGLWLHAPRSEGYSHRHVALWVDGKVTEGDFHRAVDSHVRNHRFARDRHHDYGDAISVRSPDEYAIATPAGSSRSNPEADRERGETTGLTCEIGNNIPALGADSDVRNCSQPVFIWAAMMWSLDRTSWHPLGNFNEYADFWKECYS